MRCHRLGAGVIVIRGQQLSNLRACPRRAVQIARCLEPVAAALREARAGVCPEDTLMGGGSVTQSHQPPSSTSRSGG